MKVVFAVAGRHERGVFIPGVPVHEPDADLPAVLLRRHADAIGEDTSNRSCCIVIVG